MFYCDKCGWVKGWPIKQVMSSFGPCEICEETVVCNDIPSGFLCSDPPRIPIDASSEFMRKLQEHIAKMETHGIHRPA